MAPIMDNNNPSGNVPLKALFVELAQLDDALRDPSVAMDNAEYERTCERHWALREQIAATPMLAADDQVWLAYTFQLEAERDSEFENHGPGSARHLAQALAENILRRSANMADLKSVWQRAEIPSNKLTSFELIGEASKYRTGAPGRPTPMDFVVREAERRRAAGEALLNLSAEATELHEWCKLNHAAIPAPTAKTIENRIRQSHRNWKTRSHHPPKL